MRIHLSPPRALALAAVVAPFVFALTASTTRATEPASASRSLPAEIAEARAEADKDKSAFRHLILGRLLIEANQPDVADKVAATMDGLSDNTVEAAQLRAEIAIARKQVSAALKIYDELLTAHADDGGTFTLRGRLKFQNNLADCGLADFNRAIELSDNNDTDALLFRSQLRTANKDLTGAALDLSRILELENGRDEIRLTRASLYVTLQLRRLALDDFDALLVSAPNDAALLAARAKAAALPENPPAAVTQQITTLIRQSTNALTKKDEATAARAFNQAILAASNRDPNLAAEPMLYIERGDLLAASKSIELAKEDYRRARYSGELIPPALLRLARLAFADKDYAVTLAHVRSINAEQDPSVAAEAWLLGARAHLGFYKDSPDPESLVSAAEALQTARQLEALPADIASIDKEITSLRNLARGTAIAAISPDKIFEALALAREEAEGSSGSFACYDRLLRLYPANVEIYESRVASMEKTRSNDPRKNAFKAIAASLQSAAPKVPASGSESDLALARANLAVYSRPHVSGPYIERSRIRVARAEATRAHNNVSEADAALADAKLAVEIDPYDPQAYVAFAEALIAKKDTVTDYIGSARDNLLIEAATAADRALALAPDDIALIIWAGDQRRDQGVNLLTCKAEALRLYARACRADSRSTRALIAHAQMAMKLGDAPAAVADYQRVRLLEPENLYALYELGVAQLYARSYIDAVASFKSLEQTLASAGDRTSTDAVETLQLRAVALAAAGDPAAESIAKEVLTRSEWIGNADAALDNLTQQKPHAALLDRLYAMKGTRNKALNANRENQQETSLDASPR